MNRRTFATSILTVALLPQLATASQSEATPEVELRQENDPVDTRTRDLSNQTVGSARDRRGNESCTHRG